MDALSTSTGTQHRHSPTMYTLTDKIQFARGEAIGEYINLFRDRFVFARQPMPHRPCEIRPTQFFASSCSDTFPSLSHVTPACPDRPTELPLDILPACP